MKPFASNIGPLIATGLVAFLASCSGGETDGQSARATGAHFDSPATGAAAAGGFPEIPDGAPTVAFVGDSIGAGLHLSEHQAFPAFVQAHLAEEFPFHLVNASESGRTTAGGLTAIGWVLRSEPDIVVIELGGNDGLRGIALEEIEQNLRKTIGKARASGAEVLLLGIRLPENYGAYGTRFDKMYPRLAEELDVTFVPHFMGGVGGIAEMNLPDGLHPTPKGHERLAENVAPALRELLRAQR